MVELPKKLLLTILEGAADWICGMGGNQVYLVTSLCKFFLVWIFLVFFFIFYIGDVYNTKYWNSGLWMFLKEWWLLACCVSVCPVHQSVCLLCTVIAMVIIIIIITLIIIIIRGLIIFVPPLGLQHWRQEATFYHRQYKLRQTEGTSHHQHWYHHPRPRDHHWYHHFPICTQLGRRQHFNLIHYTNTNAWLLSFIITN